MRPRSFQRLFRRRPTKLGPGGARFPVAVERSATPLPVESLPNYWHPERHGVEPAPDDFDRELKAIHPDLAVCRPPANAPLPHKWAVWYRKPSVTHHLCPGWTLLFIWPPEPFKPIPLDNRVFANLFKIHRRRFGSAVKYFDHCMAELAAEKQQRQLGTKATSKDMQREWRKSLQIKNIGRGNKFALHHDGTMVPSRATINWLKETRKSRYPKEMTEDLARSRGR